MKIAIISLQGAFVEHAEILKKASSELNIKCGIILARTKKDLKGAQGIIIPGGESTTINKLLTETGMGKAIIELAKRDIPVLATCAGMILVSDTGDVQCKKTGKLLALIDMEVNRNAFGTQKQSFEVEIDLKGIGRMNAVFIRAPAVTRINDPGAEILAKTGGKIVAVGKGNVLALAFHPELTDDTKVHRYFLEKVLKFSGNIGI